MAAEIADSTLAAMRAAVDVLPRRRDQLLPALIAAEHAIDWLPEAAIEHVAAHTRIPLSEVYATVTAYSELRLEPPVEGRWNVCTGVACQQAGADALVDALGERAAPTACRFLCSLAPVIERHDGALSGRVSVEALAALTDGAS